MICRLCGQETSTVICPNCGINVVWFNKFGNMEDNYIQDLSDCEEKESDSVSIDDYLDSIYISDGSGD